MKRSIQLILVPTLLLIYASLACTEEHGLVLDRRLVDPQVMSDLDSQIARAKLETPWAFEELATVVAGLPNRRPPISASGMDPIVNHLTPIGRDGLFPMLEMMVVRAPSAASLNPTLLKELRFSLMQAVGYIGDWRAVPVLEAIVIADEVDLSERKGAAYSISLLPRDVAIAAFLSILDRDDATSDTRAAVYPVMGKCRRLVVAKRLADELYSKPDPDMATLLVAALGDLGNEDAWWAIAFSGDKRASEKDLTTRIAIDAVLWAFVRYETPGLREEVDGALKSIQHVSTQARIQEQRARASKELTTALNQLEESYLRSIESRR